MESPQEYYQKKEAPWGTTDVIRFVCTGGALIAIPVIWWYVESETAQIIVGVLLYGFVAYWIIRKFLKTRSIRATLFSPPASKVIIVIVSLISIGIFYVAVLAFVSWLAKYLRTIF